MPAHLLVVLLLVSLLVVSAGERALGNVLEEAVAARTTPEAVARRKTAIIEAVRVLNLAPSANGKQSLRAALVRLICDPNDPAALAAIRAAAPYDGHDAHFTKLMLAQIWGRFGQGLPKDIQEMIRAQASVYPHYLGSGTENHIGMRRISGMVFGSAFPEMKTPRGLTGKQLAEAAINWMRSYGSTVFRWSMSEYLSPVYFGIHHDIWLTAKEYAPTDAARLMSRAVLDWMWADLAINTHLGQVIAPVTRDKIAMTRGPQMNWPNSHIQWIAWLYWGDERSKPGSDPLPPYMKEIKPGMRVNKAIEEIAMGIQTAIIPAVSAEYPCEIIRNIGAKRVALPYTLRQSRANSGMIYKASTNAFMKSDFEAVGRNHFRSVYVAQNYALGTGYFRDELNTETPMHLTHTTIVYRSPKPLNRIVITHPYWYTAKKDETTGKELGADNWLGRSPFERTMHHGNTLLYLCDIPEKDPHFGSTIGTKNPEWLSTRKPECIRAACVYVPASIDERRQTSWGWLLREGDLYIAVRPFGTENTGWEKCEHAALAGYERLMLRGGLMGAAIEVGDKSEYGSPEAFVAALGKTSFTLTRLAKEKEVEYHSTRGSVLKLRFVPDSGLPTASINGVKLDFDNWPISESPYVSCRDGILDVNDGTKGFTIDWSGDYPKYSWYDLSAGTKTVTSTESLKGQSVSKQSIASDLLKH